jgi:hypothetical protein
MIVPMGYDAVVTRVRLVTAIAIGAALWLAVGPADAGTPAPYVTDQVTFPSSGGLRIRALLARPDGEGPFPAYISNHGSMSLQDAGKGPWSSIVPGSLGDTLARKGYVVLIVARRGYRGGHTLFSNAKGYSIFVPDAVSFLDAQLNR